MPEENKRPKSLDELRKKADKNLEIFNKKKSGRLVNIGLSLRSRLITEQKAKDDIASLLKEEREHLDHKASLYDGYMTNKFNEQSNPPNNLGAAATPQTEKKEIERQIKEEQTWEDLFKNLDQSAEKSQAESPEIDDKDHTLDDLQISNAHKDPEKGNNDLGQ